MNTSPNSTRVTGDAVGFHLQENEYRILMTHLATESPFTPTPKIRETIMSVVKDAASFDGVRGLLQKVRALLGVGCEKTSSHGLFLNS